MIEILLSTWLGLGFYEEDLASCTRSSDCFSHEHCWHDGQCVDVADQPCQSNSDCQPTESCDFETSPHRCG